MSVLWRPPIFRLEVATDRGQQPMSFRFLTSIGRSGFMLSPILRDTDGLEAWLEGEGGLERPSAIRVIDSNGALLPIEVQLQPLPQYEARGVRLP